MPMKLNDVNGEASTLVFGFKLTSKSIKPVHLAQVMFNHSLEYVHEPDALFEFATKPSKTPSAELSDEVKRHVEYTYQAADPNERLDDVRRTLRKVIANDGALYASQRGSAPTCTSDRFVLNPMTGVTPGRFLYTLIQRSGDTVIERLTQQLTDHHDSISVLFQPLLADADRSDATVKPWTEPELGATFGDDRIASAFVSGFETLAQHLKQPNGRQLNYPRDLRRVVKLGAVALYLYVANRNHELGTDDVEYHVPIVLNCTSDRNNPVADASLACYDTVTSEVKQATRRGVREWLDRNGYRSYDEDDIHDRIESRELLELNRQKESKLERDYETFKDMFDADPAADTFERLVNTVSDAIHTSRYKTYTPEGTIQVFGWRAGILKPRGNRARNRRFSLDPEVLEPILLSVLDPDESCSLQEVCVRLRNRYGLIVGGTEHDRDHLDAWDINVGASDIAGDPLSNHNYDRFKQTVIDLGYATEYADGVTIVKAEAHE